MIIFTEVNVKRNSLLNNRECNNLVNNYRNFIINDYYYFEYEKFKDYYIRYFYNENKLENIEYYNYSWKIHREDGPAWIQYYNNGEIHYKRYYLNGEYYYKDYILKINK